MLLVLYFVSLWGLSQVFVIASAARSLSWRYSLAAFGVGISASFVICLLAELGIALAIRSGDPELTLVKAAAIGRYAHDPFIEEVGKLLPLLALMTFARLRRSLCLTDFIVLGAALGAGFGMMEAALSVGSSFSNVRWMTGFFMLSGGGFGMTSLAVPDAWAAVTHWLPNPTSIVRAMDDPAVTLNSHIAYTVFAAVGFGILFKTPRFWWAATMAIAYAVLDHIGYNADVSRGDLPLALSSLLGALRPFDGLLVLASIVGAAIVDRLVYQRALAADRSLILIGERANRFAAIRQLISRLGSPSRLRALWRFILVRRGYLAAAAAGERGEAHTALRLELANAVETLKGVSQSPSIVDEAKRDDVSTTSSARRRLLSLSLIVVGVPPLIYGAAIGFVPREWMSGLFDNNVALIGMTGLVIIGMAVQGIVGAGQLYALFAVKTRNAPGDFLWHGLGLQSALGGATLGALVVLASLGRQPLAPLGQTHAIERWLSAHPIAALMLAAVVAVLTVLVPMAVATFLPRVGLGIAIVQALTGKDLLTGDKLSFLERVLGVLPGNVSTRGETAGISRRADDALEVAAKTGRRIVERIEARTLFRSHAISGKGSSKRVNRIAESMQKEGYVGAPIKVVENDGRMIVVDGHHRTAAAMRTGTSVNVEIVGPDSFPTGPGGWKSIDEVVQSSRTVEPNRLYRTRRKGG